MDTPQSLQLEIDKTQWLGPAIAGESSAQTLAELCLLDGFTLDQIVSEYGALRSSVLRLWLSQEASLDQADRLVKSNANRRQISAITHSGIMPPRKHVHHWDSAGKGGVGEGSEQRSAAWLYRLPASPK